MSRNLANHHIESLCFDHNVSYVKVLKIAVPISMGLFLLSFLVFQSFYMQAKVDALERISNLTVSLSMNNYMHEVLPQLIAVTLVITALSFLVALILERRKRTQDYLFMLSNAVEYSGEAISITDVHGVVQYVNPAFTSLTGYTAQDALHKSALDLLNSPAQSEEEYNAMIHDVTQGLVWCGKLVNEKKDGSFFPSATCISPVKNQYDEVTHYVTLQNDDSLVQHLHHKEIKEEKMKVLATAVGGIAHEFNNILMGMMGNAFLVKLKEEDADLKHKLESIEQLGQRAADMVQQMLIYVGNDLQAHDYARIPLNKFLQVQVVGFNQAESMRCTFKSWRDELFIQGDVRALSSAIVQLLSNAKDATEEVKQPQIEVSLEMMQKNQVKASKMIEGVRYACIRVTDNGSGVSEDSQSSIFEPFFTTKDVGQGTGLGLSAVYGTAKDHHGFVALDKDYKAGCSFLLCIPLLESGVPDFLGGDI